MTVNVAGPPRFVILAGRKYQRCRRFYEDVLVLPVVCEWDRRGRITEGSVRGTVYSLGQVHIELLEGKSRRYGDRVHLCVQVSDVDDLWYDLRNVANVVESITSHHWGHRAFSIADPSGARFEFYSEV